MDMFIDGARRGFTIATTNLLPNVVMAFVIIQALKITGLLDWLGHICEPVMELWGLPGEAATVLLAALMSMGGAVGVAASLATAGALTGHDVTVLLPAMYLMGNTVQNVGRCLGTPNVVMAFVIIQALKITGLLDWVGHICEPVMALWGLPGEAATVLLAALMSMGGAVGVAASLATAGALTGHDVTVLLPAMYLMGNPVQNVGRCLGTAEVNAKYYPHIITVCVINALLSIWVMQLIV